MHSAKHNSATNFVKTKGGYTLIELLIVIGLIGLTVGVTGDIILTLVRSYTKTQATNELERSSNFIVSKIEKEFKNAVTVYPGDSNTISFDTKYYNDSTIHPVSYRLTTCTSSNGNVGCLQRCPARSASCNASTWKNVTDPENIIVSFNVGPVFSNPSSGGSVDSLRMNFKFTKNIGGTANNPFSGELIVKTTVVAKGTY